MDSVNQTKSLCKRTVVYSCGGVAKGNMQECIFFKFESTKNTCGHFRVATQECRCLSAIKTLENHEHEGNEQAKTCLWDYSPRREKGSGWRGFE